MWRVLSAEFLKVCTKPAEVPAERLPEVAIAGRSNVGKSSLINALVNQKRLAMTSSTPGRTRSVNYFRVRLSPDPRPPEFPGLPCYFVDLPGYGYAKVPHSMRLQWRPLVESYLEKNGWLRGVLVLIDARRDPEEEESQLVEYLRSLGVPFQVVLTKSDKLSGGKVAERKRALGKAFELDAAASPIAFSAPRKQGIGELLSCIAQWMGGGRPEERPQHPG